jgi:catechol 2,3-dioxygenase-like lactoylglutathione lyase family enzyme
MKNESTKLSDRRRVLRAIGAGAATIGTCGAFAPGVRAFAAEAPDKPIAVTTVNHLSYSSQNYQVTRDFYVDFFGMRDVWDDGTKCQLDCGPESAPNSFYMTGAKPGTEPTIAHYGFGLPDYWDLVGQVKETLSRGHWPGVHPDGEAGWFVNGPSGYVQHIVTVKDTAMFPGASAPCEVARSDQCKAAYAMGVRNAGAFPKPSGKGFKARYFKFIVLHVADVEREADFYREAMGMRPVPKETIGVALPGDVALRFGDNTMVLRRGAADGKPYCNEFGLAVEDFDEAKARAELARRGLVARPGVAGGLVFKDPNGLDIGIAGMA